MTNKPVVTRPRKSGTKEWSHLICETDEELVWWAKWLGKIGIHIRAKGQINAHLDITVKERQKLIDAGAVETDSDVIYYP